MAPAKKKPSSASLAQKAVLSDEAFSGLWESCRELETKLATALAAANEAEKRLAEQVANNQRQALTIEALESELAGEKAAVAKLTLARDTLDAELKLARAAEAAAVKAATPTVQALESKISSLKAQVVAAERAEQTAAKEAALERVAGRRYRKVVEGLALRLGELELSTIDRQSAEAVELHQRIDGRHV